MRHSTVSVDSEGGVGVPRAAFWVRRPGSEPHLFHFTSCENLRNSFNPLKSHPHIKQAKSMTQDFKTDETGERFSLLPGM